MVHQENLLQAQSQLVNKMAKSKDIVVEDFSKLSLRIYTIGYPKQGECILCLLMEDHKIIYSFVVDSYCCSCYNDTHVACDILESLGVTGINMFVWTHPDKDHSVGIEQLLDKFDADRNAHILISEGVANNDKILKSHAIKVYKYLQKNYNTNKSHGKLSKISLTEKENRNIVSFKITEARTFRLITCNFFFVAPLSDKTIRQEFNKTKDYNAMSIMFALSLNKVNYLFCGDVEDSSLSYIDTSVFHNVKFVKIPHHGSKNSLKIIKYLKQELVKDALAVTTVYKANEKSDNLPNSKVLEMYQKVCEYIYSTNSGTEYYGCIQLDYDILQGSFTSLMEGNAIQIYP